MRKKRYGGNSEKYEEKPWDVLGVSDDAPLSEVVMKDLQEYKKKTGYRSSKSSNRNMKDYTFHNYVSPTDFDKLNHLIANNSSVYIDIQPRKRQIKHDSADDDDDDDDDDDAQELQQAITLKNTINTTSAAIMEQDNRRLKVLLQECKTFQDNCILHDCVFGGSKKTDSDLDLVSHVKTLLTFLQQAPIVVSTQVSSLLIEVNKVILYCVENNDPETRIRVRNIFKLHSYTGACPVLYLLVLMNKMSDFHKKQLSKLFTECNKFSDYSSEFRRWCMSDVKMSLKSLVDVHSGKNASLKENFKVFTSLVQRQSGGTKTNATYTRKRSKPRRSTRRSRGGVASTVETYTHFKVNNVKTVRATNKLATRDVFADISLSLERITHDFSLAFETKIKWFVNIALDNVGSLGVLTKKTVSDMQNELHCGEQQLLHPKFLPGIVETGNDITRWREEYVTLVKACNNPRWSNDEIAVSDKGTPAIISMFPTSYTNISFTIYDDCGDEQPKTLLTVSVVGALDQSKTEHKVENITVTYNTEGITQISAAISGDVIIIPYVVIVYSGTPEKEHTVHETTRFKPSPALFAENILLKKKLHKRIKFVFGLFDRFSNILKMPCLSEDTRLNTRITDLFTVLSNAFDYRRIATEESNPSRQQLIDAPRIKAHEYLQTHHDSYNYIDLYVDDTQLKTLVSNLRTFVSEIDNKIRPAFDTLKKNSESLVTTPSQPRQANSDAGSSIVITDPKFATYHKMIKMRLPEGAVRLKMTTDGMSDKDITVFFPTDTVDVAKKPKPKSSESDNRLIDLVQGIHELNDTGSESGREYQIFYNIIKELFEFIRMYNI